MKIVRIIKRKMRKLKIKMTVTMMTNKMITEIMRINDDNELLWSHYVASCCKELLTYAALKNIKSWRKKEILVSELEGFPASQSPQICCGLTLPYLLERPRVIFPSG